MRINFLEHLEYWKKDCIKMANQTILEKASRNHIPLTLTENNWCYPLQEEETKTELDLRLHLHEPRPARITKDIFEVRTSKENKNCFGHQHSNA